MRSCAKDLSLRVSSLCHLLGVGLRGLYDKCRQPKPVHPKKPAKAQAFAERRVAVTTLALAYPYWGYKRIAVLARREGWEISDRKVYKLLKKLDLLAKKTKPKGEVYQAMKLFELLPQKPNQLWQTDVTYINIPGHGWWYAVTVIDYYSRYLLACHLTPSYRAVDCIDAFEMALVEAENVAGAVPENLTLVTDNGSSFIARRFQGMLKQYGFTHARIQYRTPTQLGLLERFHGTLKKEEVYWHVYVNPHHARESLEAFRRRYNYVRPHWALKRESGGDPVTPAEVFTGNIRCQIPKWQGWAKAAKKKLEDEINGLVENEHSHKIAI